jgi:hypothetical protein
VVGLGSLLNLFGGSLRRELRLLLSTSFSRQAIAALACILLRTVEHTQTPSETGHQAQIEEKQCSRP